MKKIILSILSFVIILVCIEWLFAQSITYIAEQAGKSVVMIIVYDVTGSAISQGSGVFISETGIILTNAHVLEDAYSAEVYSNIGNFNKIQILHKDIKRDLAMIRISTDKSIPINNSNYNILKAGQRVIAIGNPLGLEKTVSDGLISGIRRTEDGIEMIQTTVPISPGSSGGVLLNENGFLIGITTSSFSGGQNINFAISINTILKFVEDFSKSDPKLIKYEQLKPAKETVWYRVIIHWVGKIIGFILNLIFGSTLYYVIPIIAIVCYVIYGIFKGLRWIILYPFRKYQEHKEKTRFLAPQYSQANEDAQNNFIVFFCSECGYKYTLSINVCRETIECISCKTQITIPYNQPVNNNVIMEHMDSPFFQDKYIEESTDGMQDGQGTQTFTNDDKCVAMFIDGKRPEPGTCIDGYVNRYVGEYKDDKPHGQGTMIFVYGAKYIGEFKNGKTYGNGTYIYPDGRKYVGEFKDGSMHGQGTLYNADGEIIKKGLWENDKYVSQ